MDILEIFNAAMGGPVIRQASALLGEPEDQTHLAVRATGPTLLAGLLQRASAPAGTSEVFNRVTDANVDPDISGKLASLFANRGSYESLLSRGQSLSDLLFGGRTGTVATALADSSGIRPNSALTLLSIGAPLLFGMLKKYVANNDLDPSSLTSLLLRQQPSLERSRLDPRIAGALGFGSVAELLDALSSSHQAAPKAAAQSKSRERSWLPWAAAAAIAALGLLFFVSRTADHQGTPGGRVEIAEVPDAGAPAEQDQARADSAGVAATADSARVYFDTGDASIDHEDRLRIASVAETAKSSDRPVAITGYTDQKGNADSNDKLVRNRAEAVRNALVNEGVAESQIVMDPPKPVTSSDSDDEAGRVDINVQ
jgi:OOP family OmpA-OmpF porin